jgi:hypothetical protein
VASPPLDPGESLQLAVFAALTGSPDVIAAFQALAKNPAPVPRVYDTPPPGTPVQFTAVFPYFTIGEDQIVPDAPQVTDWAYAKVDIWSRSPDFLEAKTLAGAARRALSGRLVIQGFNTVTWRVHPSPPARRQPDGLTRLVTLTVAYLLCPAAIPAPA